MKVYIAHNFKAASFIKEEVVWLLNKEGIEVTSSWLDVVQMPELLAGRNQALDAQQDIDDIDKADVLLFFCDQYGSTPGRGKYFELGYAKAAKKPVLIIGSRHEAEKCVFCALFPRVEAVPAAIDWLEAL